MEGIAEKIAKELINIRGAISTQELAERLGVSVSSIKHNLESVRELVGEHGGALVSVPQKGFSIEADEEQRDEIMNALRKSMNYDPASEGFRRDYIFQTVFQYQGKYTISLFAEELYVSRNVIAKDLHYLNKMLQPFHVKFTAKKNSGIIIEGHEFEIRQAIIYYNNQKWWKEAYLEVPEALDVRFSKRAWSYISKFYSESIKKVWAYQNILLEMEESVGNTFTDIAFGRLMEYLLITGERIRQGKCIRTYIDPERLMIKKEYLNAAEKFLALYLSEDMECWNYERAYLAARLFVADTQQSGRRTCGCREEAGAYLDEVRNCVGGEGYFSREYETLIEQLEDLVTAVLYRSTYRIYDWTDVGKDVKEHLTGLYAVCMMKIYILEEWSGNKFQEDDIAQIVLLIHNYMKKQRKEAVLVTASNENTSSYHLSKLKAAFPYLCFRKIINYQNFRLRDYSRAWVISTVALKEEADNLICITKHVSEPDIEKIRNTLHINRAHEEGILKRVFTKSLILDITARNKEDALRKIADEMACQGCVQKGFFEEVQKREDILETAIGNEIAIPHVYRRCVLESRVAVARLKNSVEWAKDERVDLIFLFAIGNEEAEDIKRIFNHIYYVLKEDGLIDRIRNAKEKDEILGLLSNCENGARH